MTTLERCHQADLEIRSDGRTVFGIVMPYNVEATVDDGDGPYIEVFRYGAFAKSISERGDRIKLVVNHDKSNRLPIGVSSNFKEDRAGLRGEFRVSATKEGDETLTLIRDGVADSFSAGFIPVIPSARDRIPASRMVERTEAKLDHVAVVGFPAYSGARIAGVRSQFDIAAIWDDLSPDEQAAMRDLDLLTLIRQSISHEDVTTEGAANDGTSDVADEQEPTTEAASRTSDGHSDITHQPVQPSALTHERRRQDLQRARAAIAAATARSK